jgi:hypothetical protein
MLTKSKLGNMMDDYLNFDNIRVNFLNQTNIRRARQKVATLIQLEFIAFRIKGTRIIVYKCYKTVYLEIRLIKEDNTMVNESKKFLKFENDIIYHNNDF